MDDIKSQGLASVLLTVTLLTSGCVSDRVDLVGTQQVRVECMPSEAVKLRAPSVWAQHETTVIYGSVMKRLPSAGLRAGHVHVVIESPGGILDEHEAAWTPRHIPRSRPPAGQRRHSNYTISRAGVIPPGSTVRVWACFGRHPSTTAAQRPSEILSTGVRVGGDAPKPKTECHHA